MVRNSDQMAIPQNERQCLFCKHVPPTSLLTKDMNLRAGWYSNGLYPIGGPYDEVAVRFFICPKHRPRIQEAWSWAREGMDAEAIEDLNGMRAVMAWFKRHPELKHLEKKYFPET